MIRFAILLLIIGCSSLYLDTLDESTIIIESTNSIYAAEVGRKSTIMKFVGEDDIEETFFSRVISIENYINGKKHGIWIYYKEDGSIDKIEMYNNGELVK